MGLNGPKKEKNKQTKKTFTQVSVQFISALSHDMDKQFIRDTKAMLV